MIAYIITMVTRCSVAAFYFKDNVPDAQSDVLQIPALQPSEITGPQQQTPHETTSGANLRRLKKTTKACASTNQSALPVMPNP